MGRCGGISIAARVGLGDVDRQVSDAFHVKGNVDEGDQEAQVERRRLLQCDQLDGSRLVLPVPPVELVVAGDHRLTERHVVAVERLEAELERSSCGGGHVGDFRLERLEIAMKLRSVLEPWWRRFRRRRLMFANPHGMIVMLGAPAGQRQTS